MSSRTAKTIGSTHRGTKERFMGIHDEADPDRLIWSMPRPKFSRIRPYHVEGHSRAHVRVGACSHGTHAPLGNITRQYYPYLFMRGIAVANRYRRRSMLAGITTTPSRSPDSEKGLFFLNHVGCRYQKAWVGIEFHRLCSFLPTTTVQETYTLLLATGSLST